jgi:hypothetical protein
MKNSFIQNFNTVPFMVETIDKALSSPTIDTKINALELIETARSNTEKHKSMSDCQNISHDIASQIDGKVILVGDEISKHALVIKEEVIYDAIFGNFTGVRRNETSVQGVNQFRYEGDTFFIKRSNSRAGTYIEQSYQIPKQQSPVELKPFELTKNNFSQTPYLVSIWRYMQDGHLEGSLNLFAQGLEDNGKIAIKCEVPSQKSFTTFSYISNTNDFDPKAKDYIETIQILSEQLNLVKRPPAEAGGFEQLFVVRLPTDR